MSHRQSTTDDREEIEGLYSIETRKGDIIYTEKDPRYVGDKEEWPDSSQAYVIAYNGVYWALLSGVYCGDRPGYGYDITDIIYTSDNKYDCMRYLDELMD